MNYEQKINYMRLAANVCRYGMTDKDVDLLVSLYELIIEKQGNTDLEDIAKAEAGAIKRDDARKKIELLNKVSEKKP